MMDNQTQIKFLEDRLELCSTQEFNELLIDIEEMLNGITDVELIHNNEQLWFVRGQVNILKYILTLKQSTEVQLELLQEEMGNNDVV